jgi:hydroxymethylglutaryl-CoA lyase
MVANLATETLLATLRELGAELPEIDALEHLVAMSAEMERRFGVAMQ